MIYDGIVIKIDNKIDKAQFYLFMVDPVSEELQDGINISEHSCYDDMKTDQVMVVKVTLKDGTMELNDVDLDEFIHGDKYGKHDIFLYIQDQLLYDIGKGEDEGIEKTSLEDVIKNGNLNNLASELIEKTVDELKKLKKK